MHRGNRKLTHYAHLIRVDLRELGLLMKWIRSDNDFPGSVYAARARDQIVSRRYDWVRWIYTGLSEFGVKKEIAYETHCRSHIAGRLECSLVDTGQSSTHQCRRRCAPVPEGGQEAAKGE